MIYNVTAATCINGIVKVENVKVEYGKGTTVSIIPNAGYTIDSVKVNEVDVTSSVSEKDESTLTFDINNITEDKEVEVTFKLSEVASIEDVSFNSGDAVRWNLDGTFYVFAKGSTVTFKTAKQGIKITYSDNTTAGGRLTNSVDITTTKTIKKIQLRYDLSWHDISTVTSTNPLKIVIDSTKPTLTLTPDSANANGYYNNDVSVAICAEDEGDYSGISKIEYWITCDGTETKRETLYTYAAGDETKSAYTGNIIVDAAINNSDNVIVNLQVTDRAGNIGQISKALKINLTKPTVSVSIDGTQHAEAKTGYYNGNRTATITITDRATCFDETAAFNGITISAKNAMGNDVTISKAAMLSSWTHSGNTHTATLTFSTDAIYTWNISYTDKADLVNDGITSTGNDVYAFTVDKTAPTGNIKIGSNTWSSLLSTLTFGIWKNYSVTASGTGSDVTSPLYNIMYYKSNTDTALSNTDLVALYNEDKFTTDTVSVNSDEQFAVYARITDYAGNTLYIGSNGVIVDMTKGVITLTPDVPNKNGFYNDDVQVAISVNEETVVGKAYSGIKTVDYKVIKDNDTENPTQSGNLYSFDTVNPTKSQLQKDWSGSITVDKTKNNSDNIKVVVTVIDNAGNEYSQETALAINIDKPTVDVKFTDQANKIVDGRGYFGAARTATVTIVDRASAFNAASATDGIVINAVDTKGNSVSLDTSSMISAWSHNGDKHTATITFNADGNYTWSLSYTNNAENANAEVTTGTSVTPYTFTVDKTDPSGTITVNTNTWDKLLNVLTFGLYSNIKADVTATATDATSPVTVEYFKTNNPVAMTATQLDNQSFSEYNDFSINADEQFIVYLKITDYAGNYIYINSDGCIVDKVASGIALTPDKANSNNLYNKDVNVAIAVTDAEPYSGIKTVDYWVENNNVKTQEGNLFTFSVTDPKQADLVDEWNGSITVDSSKNNSCNVVVYVKTVDNAGNENTESIALDIDITKPTIDVTFDNNSDNDGNTYFNATRTATIVITERTHHFDATAATNGIVITAVDAKGNTVENAYTISTWTTANASANPDEATHTATIAFEKDANYTFAIAYTDKADNANSAVNQHDSVAPFDFTVDTTAPTGTVKAVSEEGREVEWNELRNELTFGFWSNKKITISGTSDDITSPVASVKYYKAVSQNASDVTTALTTAELDAITSWTDFSGFDVLPNEQFTVYIKITDNAGNYTYISTNGLIVDKEKPLEEAIAPEITITPEQPINGIYKGDVKVSIKVTDPLTNGTYSGLKEVSYKVFDKAISTTEPTQSGTLYNFEKTDPKQSELLQTWTGEITVDSTKNNSNDIQIIVYATDNSLNSSDDDVAIKIDTTAPLINISYDNNSADSNTFFKKNRTATIVVTERNFNADDVKINITNTDGTIPAVSKWKESKGTGNLDDTTWTATVTYAVDGDYTFAMDYTDLAGNACSGVQYASNTVAANKFTIDKTLPLIQVSYDNNNAENDKYFKSTRTATIVITEHNFDVSRVKFTQTAALDGVNITSPTATWKNNGDVHTATITYNTDGDYTFDVTMDDMAGNESGNANYGTSVAGKEFVVDTEIAKPTITGVENGKAYNGDVISVISFTDINFDTDKVTLTRTRKDEKDVDVTSEFIKTLNTDAKGGSGTNDTFAKEQKNDGIYTLSVKITDKAGNEESQTVTFTVNRFGSVYEYSDYLVSLIKDGGSYVQSVSDNLIITEYNADQLVNGSLAIDITRDGKPVSDVEYDVSPVVNDQVAVGESGWFQYQYTISKDNFATDGVYKISVSSKDAAGNTPENTNYEDQNILFRVDNTVPELTSITGLEKSIINAQEVTVKYNAYDTIGLKSIKVYVDGQQVGNEITDFSGDQNNYDGSFIINESKSAQTVRLVVEDLAGNVTDTDSDKFTSTYVFEKAVTVSTNAFVRWYADKILFFGSIGVVAVLGAGIGIFVGLKKKKKVTAK